MKVYALVLAGYEDINNWSARYKQYSELIDALELWCCIAISIRYEHDENICQKLKKFYHKKGTSEFYFVKSLDEKRVFKPFVESFIEYLGIEADKDFVEAIMDSIEAALELVQENNTLMLDEAFKDELDLLIPGIKRELNGNEADDEDVEGNDKRYTFTGHTEEVESEDNTTEDESEQDDSPSENNLGKQEEPSEEESGEDIEYLREEEFEDDDEREAIEKSAEDLDEDDFRKITTLFYKYNGEEIETVCEHYRSGTWVRGHYRNGFWVNGYWRNGSNVSEHDRSSNHNGSNWSPSDSTSATNLPSEESMDNTNKGAAISDKGGTLDHPQSQWKSENSGRSLKRHDADGLTQKESNREARMHAKRILVNKRL